MATRSEVVLITGIRGFTGEHLNARLTRAGYDVYGLVHQSAQGDKEIECDITSPEETLAALKRVRPDYVVHLAAITFVPHGNFREIYQINLFGTLNLLEGLWQAGVHPRKVVIASSANVYGNPELEIIDEEICPAPVNHYANSKLAMEHMVRTHFDRLSIIITRPFNYTGVGQASHFLIPKIVQHYREGRREIELGNLDVVRDFSDVRFVVAAYQRLLECPHHSTVVNVCSGRGTALLQVIQLMNEIAGYTIETTVNPDLVRQNEIERLVGSNERLFSLIGEQPVYSIRDILHAMYSARPEV